MAIYIARKENQNQKSILRNICGRGPSCTHSCSYVKLYNEMIITLHANFMK